MPSRCPRFCILLGIPLSYSIADGLALGFIAYPVVKLLAGQARERKVADVPDCRFIGDILRDAPGTHRLKSRALGLGS